MCCPCSTAAPRPLPQQQQPHHKPPELWDTAAQQQQGRCHSSSSRYKAPLRLHSAPAAPGPLPHQQQPHHKPTQAAGYCCTTAAARSAAERSSPLSLQAASATRQHTAAATTATQPLPQLPCWSQPCLLGSGLHCYNSHRCRPAAAPMPLPMSLVWLPTGPSGKALIQLSSSSCSNCQGYTVLKADSGHQPRLTPCPDLG